LTINPSLEFAVDLKLWREIEPSVLNMVTDKKNFKLNEIASELEGALILVIYDNA
jgi:hypothetical protein